VYGQSWRTTWLELKPAKNNDEAANKALSFKWILI
jgi:hypothetical protein